MQRCPLESKASDFAAFWTPIRLAFGRIRLPGGNIDGPAKARPMIMRRFTRVIHVINRLRHDSYVVFSRFGVGRVSPP